ncbi:taurine catabolism dioxygenase [Chlorella sorokiniana]|uniref:Taurine catabolism dioxygenase n=1 Tax=Chlorella sorokiniana TaxID=3076 RepID=A0A2P6TJB5_CHLSO|nr:taurine catabolism dioxygenase [Chlorella sorokiniana]|eukprot:PRW39338.1 taurine catabolism dioxygenase [Chlorella sorokiniana]
MGRGGDGASHGAVLGQPLQHPAAWTAPDVLASDPSTWQYQLTPQDQQEIVEAAQRAVASGRPVPELTKGDFPLPSLGAKLEKIRDSVVFGRGFFLLRGFPIDRLSREEVVAAWLGVGLYWGKPRSQNAKGHLVGHVKDLPWHVDDADLVGLLCLKRAKEGGLSRWASSISIYNRLLEARPDLVEELAQTYHFDKKGEVGPGEKPYLELPVLSVYKGHLTFFYNDKYIKEAQRFPEVPRLTAKQLEALQAVTDLADSPELHLDWDLQPGDVQLIYNWTQLHFRTAYVDHPGFENRRHLLRLWLTSTVNTHAINPERFPTEAYLGIYSDKLTAPLDAE